jgi:dTDP-4-amino-4,6-dideoxy-D-galactose acyltransferase
MSLFVRPAEPCDAPDIRNILQASFGEYQAALKLSEPPAAMRDTVGDIEKSIGEQQVFVAVFNRMKAVGTIRVRKVSDNVAYISRFAVLPQWQQSGAGSALMEAALDWCRSNGLRAAALHMAVKMVKLARFYHGCGFYVHSVEASPAGYRRGLFVKELEECGEIEFDKIYPSPSALGEG